jgi:hypothetical protein
MVDDVATEDERWLSFLSMGIGLHNDVAGRMACRCVKS